MNRKIPAGATMRALVWADGGGQEISLLHAISYAAIEEALYAGGPHQPPADPLPSPPEEDGVYWLIDRKWVPDAEAWG